MAKSGIIRSSTARKYVRWDAEFYLGNSQLPNEIEAAQKRVEQAQQALKNKLQKLLEEQERIEKMRSAGEISRNIKS